MGTALEGEEGGKLDQRVGVGDRWSKPSRRGEGLNISYLRVGLSAV